MSFPNYFLDPEAYNRVKLGGILIKAALVEIDGIKIEAEWSAQKATGTSGPTWVFKGMNAAGPHELTFECGYDGVSTPAQMFDDLRELYERFGPVPQNTGAGASKDSPYTIGQTKNADSGGGVIPAGAGTPTDSSGFPKSTGQSVGPKPPTLSVENGFVNYHGTVACSLKSWDGPTPTPTRSVRVKLGIIPQKAPTKAGTGVAATKGDSFTLGGASSAQGGSAAADAKAAAAGAGT